MECREKIIFTCQKICFFKSSIAPNNNQLTHLVFRKNFTHWSHFQISVHFLPGHIFLNVSGEDITNANPILTNVNDKSPKCYELLWLSRKENKSLFTRTDLTISIQINFNLTGQKRRPQGEDIIFVLKMGILHFLVWFLQNQEFIANIQCTTNPRPHQTPSVRQGGRVWFRISIHSLLLESMRKRNLSSRRKLKKTDITSWKYE